jgi:hypothetical protein
MAVRQSGLKEFSRWTLLAIALNRDEAKRTAAGALSELADLFETLAAAAEVGVAGDWDAAWRSDNLAIAVTRGLFLRVASDFRAMDALLPAHPRQAASLARGVCEACAWVQLVTSTTGEAGAAELYRFYQERDGVLGDSPLLHERRALYLELASKTARSDVPELRLQQILDDTEARLADQQGSFAGLHADLLRDLPVLANHLKKPDSKKHPFTPAQARQALGGESVDEYHRFFEGFLFRTTCRIVHASDAFDYYDPETGKGLGPPERLPGRPDDANAVVAAAAVFACLVADSVAEYLAQFSPDEDRCEEEIRVLKLVGVSLAFMARSLPAVPPR